MRVEDIVAEELEKQGLIVIHTYRKGCPDIIAFPPEIAAQVQAIEVKSLTDKARQEQKDVIDHLVSKGVKAFFRRLEGDFPLWPQTSKPAKSPRSTWWESLDKSQQQQTIEAWFNDGWIAHVEGKKYSEYPKEDNPNSMLYSRHKAEWRDGWSQAEKACQIQDSRWYNLKRAYLAKEGNQ